MQQRRKSWRRRGFRLSMLLLILACTGLLGYALRDFRHDLRSRRWREMAEAGKGNLPCGEASPEQDTEKPAPDREGDAEEAAPKLSPEQAEEHGPETAGGLFPGTEADAPRAADGDRRTESDAERDPGTADVPPFPDRRIDFCRLQEMNPEIAAWIWIPGTRIDYPVCLHADDKFYLTHNAEGEKDSCGAVFFSAETDREQLFREPGSVQAGPSSGIGQGTASQDSTLAGKRFPARLILYGHNMRSGRMFGSLKKYRSEEWLREHPAVYLYTPSAVLCASVFSCFPTEDGSEAFRQDLIRNTEDYRNWLEEMAARTQTRSPYGIRPEPGEYCLTLSTCVSGPDPRERYAIHAIGIWRTSG